MSEPLRSLFPTRWWVAPNPIVIQYIVVDWLFREVDEHIEERLPVLKTIHGYRNIEVWGYLRDTKEDRDRKTCLAIYGQAH